MRAATMTARSARAHDLSSAHVRTERAGQYRGQPSRADRRRATAVAAVR